MGSFCFIPRPQIIYPVYSGGIIGLFPFLAIANNAARMPLVRGFWQTCVHISVGYILRSRVSGVKVYSLSRELSNTFQGRVPVHTPSCSLPLPKFDIVSLLI